MVGLPGTGLVDPAIHADWIWHDLEHLLRRHRAVVRVLFRCSAGHGQGVAPLDHPQTSGMVYLPVPRLTAIYPILHGLRGLRDDPALGL